MGSFPEGVGTSVGGDTEEIVMFLCSVLSPQPVSMADWARITTGLIQKHSPAFCAGEWYSLINSCFNMTDD